MENKIVVSADYLYTFANDVVSVRISTEMCSVMVDFYVNGVQVYYAMLGESDSVHIDDALVINKAMERMEVDTSRWIADCTWLINNYSQLVLKRKISKYQFPFQGTNSGSVYLNVVQDVTSKVRLTITNEQNSDNIKCCVEAESIQGLLDILQEYSSSVGVILDIFRNNSLELNKPTAQKNFV